MLISQILRAHPVKREIRERRLRAPAGRHIQVINQLLNALKNLLVRQIVLTDVRCHIGVKRRKCLSPRPLVLHRAKEIHDLTGGGRKMLRRPGFHLPGNPIQSFLQKRT